MYATEDNATLTVTDTAEDRVVNLSGTTDLTIKGGFSVLDGSGGGSGLKLVDNSEANTIIASEDGSTLYGTHGGNNSLKGGSGSDMFLLTLGGGDQTIDGVSEGDVIYFRGTTKANIRTANVEASDSTWKFYNAKGSLTFINVSGSFTAKFTNGDVSAESFDDLFTQLKITPTGTSSDLFDNYDAGEIILARDI